VSNFQLAHNVTVLTDFADGYTLYDARYALTGHTHAFSDHGALSGLADDDHTQYALLAGRSGGQTLIGGTASGNDLILSSTSHATKGQIFFSAAQVSHFDEANERLNTGNESDDTTNASRPINLIATNATMRVFRVTSNLATASPAVELIGSANASDTQANWSGFWDFYVGSGDSFNIRRRAISGLGYGDQVMIDISPAGVVHLFDEIEIDGNLNHDGSNVGFYGVAPVARPSAYTQTYATADKTHANLTSTSIAAAIPAAAPAGGVGTAAGGWDTAANRNSAITTINGLRTWALEIDADYEAMLVDLTDLKQLVNSIIDDLQALGLVQ